MSQQTRRATMASLLFTLATCTGFAAALTASQAQAARPTVSSNAAAIEQNSTAIQENRDAICALVDKTSLTPRPSFCPAPPSCPCWVGYTPDQILAELEAEAGNVTTPFCLLNPGTQVAIGDDYDGQPSVQAAISGSTGVCAVSGLGPIPDMSPTLLTLEEAQHCVAQLEAIVGSVSWCPSPP